MCAPFAVIESGTCMARSAMTSAGVPFMEVSKVREKRLPLSEKPIESGAGAWSAVSMRALVRPAIALASEPILLLNDRRW